MTPLFGQSDDRFGRRETGLIQRVRASLRRGPNLDTRRVVVGYSGGADSLALLLVLRDLRRLGVLTVSAVHVDHGVREESAADADACKRVCAKLDVPFEMKTIDPGALSQHVGVGREEAMRRERYAALAGHARQVSADAIAVAHHQRDQTETMLLHLLRGAGTDGLRGMTEWSSQPIPWWGDNGAAVTVWRPLLHEPADEIRTLAQMSGFPVVDDASNTDGQYRRNAIRHRLLPVIEDIAPGATAAIARSADLLADDADVLAALVPELRDELPCATFADLPLAIGRRTIRAWLARHGHAVDLTANRVDAVLTAARSGRSGVHIELGSGRWVVIDRGMMRVTASK